MSAVWSFLFDRQTDPLGLPLAAWEEYIILAIIGELAYLIAYFTVGVMLDLELIWEGAGSIMHWITRLIVFVLMWAITYGLVRFIQFITSYWVQILCGIGEIIVAALKGMVIAVIIKRRSEK